MGSYTSIEIEPGTAIEQACQDALRVANGLSIGVKFTFNGVKCYAMPGGSSDELAENWHRELSRELKAPLDSRFAMTDATSAVRYLKAQYAAGGQP